MSLCLFQLGAYNYDLDCKKDHYPTVFAVPSAFLNWIKDNMVWGKCD